MLIAWGLLAILLLTVATGYFVAQEFAFVAVDRNALATRAQDGDSKAARALEITGRLSFMLSGAQLGITVTALLVGYVAEPLLGEGIAAVLGLADVPTAIAVAVGVALALLFATVVQMVLGELAPKNWGVAQPERVARALAGSTVVYLKVFGPVIRLFDAASNKLLRSVGIEPVEELPHGATPEDLEQIVRESHEGGRLDTELSRQLDRGLDFAGLTAEQAMTPRVEVDTVGAEAPVSAVLDLLATGHSRFPVTGESVDDVLGVVGIRDLLACPAGERAHTPVRRWISAPLLIPSTLPLHTALERLRSARRRMACVVDEFGGFAGVLTLEDLAEELVGEIVGDGESAPASAVRRADGRHEVPGRLRIDEVTDATGVPLPDGDDYETVSGLVLRELGRIARVGDRVRVPLPPVDVTAAGPGRTAVIDVLAVQRRVPLTVLLTVEEDGR